jgi:kanamycin kinase
MKLTPITINTDEYPLKLREYLSNSKVYDSSCSPEAKVVFIDKDDGYSLKSSPKGTLEREAAMTRYFYSIGLSTEVLVYISDERDWLLTSKIHGDDCVSEKYLKQPERLCDTLAQQLAFLHSKDFADCPIQNHTELYITNAKQNKINGTFDKSNFPDSFGYTSAEEAWGIVKKYGHLLKTDTLLHGDYCLPNIILILRLELIN